MQRFYGCSSWNHDANDANLQFKSVCDLCLSTMLYTNKTVIMFIMCVLIEIFVSLLVGFGLWPACPKANESNYLYGRRPCGSSRFWGTFWQVVALNRTAQTILSSLILLYYTFWPFWFPSSDAGLAGVFYWWSLTWWWRLEERVLPSPPPSPCFAFSAFVAAWPCLV